jgi:FkbM family methyltransferase
MKRRQLAMAIQEATLDLTRHLIAGVLRVGGAAGSTMQSHSARRARRLPRFFWASDPIVEARRRGYRYRLDLRDNVQRAFFFTGWYERRYNQALTAAMRKGDVAVDVGAHVGLLSIEFAKRLRELGAGQVFAFEPASDTVKALEWNVEANHLDNVEVVQLALGSGTGNVALHSDPQRFDPADVAIRSIYGPGGADETVELSTFDAWAERSSLERLDIVKIDVEGGEMDVLRGMSKSIERFAPRLIGIEIRDYLLRQAGVSEVELRDWLDSAGYREVRCGDLEGNFIFARS